MSRPKHEGLTRFLRGGRAVASSRRPIFTLFRYGTSIARKCFAPLRTPVVRYELGQCGILADLSTSLGLDIYRRGYYDPEIEFVRRLLQPGDTFVDGGANIGLFTLAAANQVGPEGRVVAFEPAPWPNQMLQRNIQLNRFHWVSAQAKALGELRESLRFVAFQGDGSGLSSFTPESAEGGDVVEVEVCPLDEAVPPDCWARLTIVKLDLEGAEYKALLGAKRLLEETQANLLLEVSEENLCRTGSSEEMLIGFLAARGYRAYVPQVRPNGQLALIVPNAASQQRNSTNLFFSKSSTPLRAKGIEVADDPG